jgi:hypothetical protein
VIRVPVYSSTFIGGFSPVTPRAPRGSCRSLRSLRLGSATLCGSNDPFLLLSPLIGVHRRASAWLAALRGIPLFLIQSKIQNRSIWLFT